MLTVARRAGRLTDPFDRICRGLESALLHAPHLRNYRLKESTG